MADRYRGYGLVAARGILIHSANVFTLEFIHIRLIPPFVPHPSTHPCFLLEEAAEEGWSTRVAEKQGEEAGSQPSSDGCGAVVFRILRGIIAAPVFYIVEPFVWYRYVKNQLRFEEFEKFEESFFMSSAFCESLGQAVFFLALILAGFAWWGDPSVQSVSPYLLILWPRILGNVLSSLPALRWATFEALWRWDFHYHRRLTCLRRTLSFCCFGLAALIVFCSINDALAHPEDYFLLRLSAFFMCAWGLLMYPLIIVFERNILVSDRRKLCPGPLGDWFLAFRTFELFVVTPVMSFAVLWSYL